MTWLLVVAVGGSMVVAANFVVIYGILSPKFLWNHYNAPGVRRCFDNIFDTKTFGAICFGWFFIFLEAMLSLRTPRVDMPFPMYWIINWPLKWWGEHAGVPGVPAAMPLWHVFVLWFHYDITIFALVLVWNVLWYGIVRIEHAVRPPVPPKIDQDAKPQEAAVLEERHPSISPIISFTTYRSRRHKADESQKKGG